MANNFADAAGGSKRWRTDEQEGRLEEALAEAIPVDRISALPDELRQRLLTHLSLKDAIRTGVLARGWRDLWKSRWSDRSSVEIHLNSRDAKQRELDALEREPRPRRRLDRFSLIVDICKLNSTELRRFLDYATECRVEDLHVETRKTTVAEKLNFHLPQSSPLLASLSLRRINISGRFYKDAQPLQALEIIRLHSVNVSPAAVSKMMALCPNLLTLDLRDCDSDDFFFSHKCPDVYPPKLRSLSFVECEGHVWLYSVDLPSLRSYRYSCCEKSFSIPKDVELADLYLCLDYSISGNSDISSFNKSLPNDLSGLTVLTICSNVLMGASSPWYDEQVSWGNKFLISRDQQVASSSVDDGSTARNPKLCNLQSLRELQLLMQNMRAGNLANIYMFLKTCQCPNLERIFVQLTTSNSVPMNAPIDEVVEEPPECALDNLKIVKIVNFNWRRIEVHLVSFLLRKASSLHKLLLVSPNVAPLDIPGVQEADLLLLKEAISNGKTTLVNRTMMQFSHITVRNILSCSCQQAVESWPYGL